MSSDMNRSMSLLLQPNSDWQMQPNMSQFTGYIGAAFAYPQSAAATLGINMPKCAQSLPVSVFAFDSDRGGYADTGSGTGERYVMRHNVGVQGGVQQDISGLCELELSTFNKQIADFTGIGKPRSHSRPSGLPLHHTPAGQWPPQRPRPSRGDGGGTTQ